MQDVRNRNFVIHGLQDSPGAKDKEHVQKLCETELNLKPDINTCRPLGQIIPDKVRPVLVTVRSGQQASAVILLARNLRKSYNSYVRKHVYINPDLTKAQAAAAYQARCQRRLARATHNNNSNNQHLNSSSRQDRYRDRSALATASASAPIFHHGSGSDSRLKSSAAEFVPGADKS